jgi:hypothetical protein
MALCTEMGEFQEIMKSGEDLQKNLARFGQVIHLCTTVMKKEVENSSDLKLKGDLRRQIENLEIKGLLNSQFQWNLINDSAAKDYGKIE